MKRYAFTITFVFVIFFGSAALAERLAVSGAVANIRSGPGTNYGILWKVGKYYPLLILEKSGNWFRFQDYEGDEGWIHGSLVGRIPTVITKSETCNIRGGAGPSHKKFGTIGEGIPFRGIKSEGNWLNIEHADGDKGWIHKSLVW